MEQKLIYKDDVYKLAGLLFEMYNELGFGFQEKYYQRAYEQLLKDNNVEYEKESSIPINFKGKIIGRYYIDFLINNKIAIEFKVSEEFKISQIQQLLAYLNAKKIKLGLLVLITRSRIKFRRIIN